MRRAWDYTISPVSDFDDFVECFLDAQKCGNQQRGGLGTGSITLTGENKCKE